MRQVAPFGGAGVLGFVTVFMPPALDANVLWIAGAVIAWCCVFACMFGWARPPHPFSVTLPLAYLLALGLMMRSQGGAVSSLSPMIVVALFWVALYGTRPQLTLMIVGVGALNVTLLLTDSEHPVPGEWRGSVLWVAVTTLVGFSTQSLVRRIREESRLRAEERDFIDAVVGRAGALVLVLELDATIVRFNPAAERVTGIPASEAVGETLWGLGVLSASEIPGARDAFARVAAQDEPFDYEAVWIARDGTPRHVIWTNTVLVDADGLVSHVIGTGLDVTEQRIAERQLEEARRRAEAEARASEARFVDAFHYAPVGMGLVGLDGRYLSVNRAMCDMTGFSRGALESMSPRALMTHIEDIEKDNAMRRAILVGEIDHYDLELRYRHANGRTVDVAMHVTLATAADGEPTNFVTQVIDITERKRFEAQLQHMADHDSLTGLLNRRRFKIELDEQVSALASTDAGGAVLVLDVDHFKQINDTLGHQAGDQLIVSLSEILRLNLRSGDLLARLGGDEFAVMLPRATRNEARTVAAKLVAAVRANTCVLNDARPRVCTISVGIAMFAAREGLTGDDVIVDADLAMYDAKEAGRDRYAFFATDEHVESRTKARLTWLDRIEQAIDNDGFVLEAQPILDLRNDTIDQHELLLRMIDEDGQRLPPAAFLYVAERYGLIARIDQWVVHKAIALLADAERAGTPRRFEVNLSGASIGDPVLLASITDDLARSGVDPSNLIFEITETAAVSDIQRARSFALALKDLGCQFALDDFGAGFGSFYYLKHLPFDYLKIDGEFIKQCMHNRTDQLVIGAVVDIARGLGKQTIAEFVQDEPTCLLLEHLGVDYAQGYHIGMPEPLETVFDRGRFVRPARVIDPLVASRR